MVDALSTMMELATYEQWCENAEEIRAIWHNFEEDDVDVDIVDAMDGFVCQALLTLHSDDFQEIKKHVDAGIGSF